MINDCTFCTIIKGVTLITFTYVNSRKKNGDSLQSKKANTMGSLAATFSSMAVSIGIAMQNATTNQHNGQNIATTCLAQCCKLIIIKGAAGGASA